MTTLAVGTTLSLWAGLVAPAPSIGVIADADSAPYRDALVALEEVASDLVHYQVDDPRLLLHLRNNTGRVWIAMGERSARLLSAHPTPRRAAMLVRAHDAPAGLPTVTLEVPPQRQLIWIRRAFANRRRVITLQSSTNTVGNAAIRAAATAAGLEVEHLTVRSAGEVVPTLERAIRGRERSTVIWLTPDPSIITADSIGPLVQAAMAARVPVVGFSRYFLRVGAIGAVEVDFGAASLQALQRANDLHDGSSIHEPPRSAYLVVDGRLAERLGIVVMGGDEIEVRR